MGSRGGTGVGSLNSPLEVTDLALRGAEPAHYRLFLLKRPLYQFFAKSRTDLSLL